MSNNKQSSVDWFIDQLEEKGKAYAETVGVRTVNICIDVSEYMELKTKAKEMEKEQMKIAFEIYRDLLSHYEDGSAFEDYYKQTYGGNNEQQ